MFFILVEKIKSLRFFNIAKMYWQKGVIRLLFVYS